MGGAQIATETRTASVIPEDSIAVDPESLFDVAGKRALENDQTENGSPEISTELAIYTPENHAVNTLIGEIDESKGIPPEPMANLEAIATTELPSSDNNSNIVDVEARVVDPNIRVNSGAKSTNDSDNMVSKGVKAGQIVDVEAVIPLGQTIRQTTPTDADQPAQTVAENVAGIQEAEQPTQLDQETITRNAEALKQAQERIAEMLSNKLGERVDPNITLAFAEALIDINPEQMRLDELVEKTGKAIDQIEQEVLFKVFQKVYYQQQYQSEVKRLSETGINQDLAEEQAKLFAQEQTDQFVQQTDAFKQKQKNLRKEQFWQQFSYQFGQLLGNQIVQLLKFPDIIGTIINELAH